MSKRHGDVFSNQALAEFLEEYRDEEDIKGKKREIPLSGFTNLDVKGAGPHWVILKVEDRLVREVETGSGTLYKDPTYDIYKNTKICAEVVAAPSRLLGSVLYEKEEGFPQPMGKRNHVTGKPYATPYRTRFQTMQQAEVQVQPGDKVYFHYHTLSPHNYVGKDTEGMELYKCPYDQLFCVIRESSRVVENEDGTVDYLTGSMMIMLNGYVAVEPMFDEAYEEIEIPDMNLFGKDTGRTRKIRVKQQNGIIYDMDEKPLYRHGTIWSLTSPSPDGLEYGLGAGDKIVYTHYSQFANTIEGIEYYIMKLWDIVGVYRDGKLKPVGNNVLMDATPPRAKSKLFLPPHLKIDRNKDDGVVLDIGDHVREVEPGDKVRFYRNDAYMIKTHRFEGTLIKESLIYVKYLS